MLKTPQRSLYLKDSYEFLDSFLLLFVPKSLQKHLANTDSCRLNRFKANIMHYACTKSLAAMLMLIYLLSMVKSSDLRIHLAYSSWCINQSKYLHIFRLKSEIDNLISVVLRKGYFLCQHVLTPSEVLNKA